LRVPWRTESSRHAPRAVADGTRSVPATFQSIRTRHHCHAITHAAEIDLVAVVQHFASFDAMSIDIGAVARMQVLDQHFAVGALQFAVFPRYHRMEYLVIAMARTSQDEREVVDLDSFVRGQGA